MKKVLILALLFFSVPCVFGASISVQSQEGRNSTPNSTGNLIKQNSILNVQSGIEANQKALNNQYTNTKSVIHKGAPTSTSTTNSSVPRPAVNPNTYVPTVYTWSRYGADSDTQINVTNNTYIYQSGSEDEASSNSNSEASETKTVEKTQAQKDEEERQALRKKYSKILSNKTMSNEKMCTSMEKYYKNATYEELDRVLNTILRLNCDIEKLRPDY